MKSHPVSGKLHGLIALHHMIRISMVVYCFRMSCSCFLWAWNPPTDIRGEHANTYFYSFENKSAYETGKLTDTHGPYCRMMPMGNVWNSMIIKNSFEETFLLHFLALMANHMVRCWTIFRQSDDHFQVCYFKDKDICRHHENQAQVKYMEDIYTSTVMTKFPYQTWAWWSLS